MSARWSSTRSKDDPPGSVTVSRLIVLVFLVAILLGVATGSIWVAWNLITRALAG